MSQFLKSLCFATILSSLALVTPAGAADYVVIGGYSDNIITAPYDAATGGIDVEQEVNTPAKSPSWLVYDKNRSLFFATNELGSASSETLGTVSSFKMEEPSEPMTRLSIQPSKGDEPTNAAMSPDGKYLFVANYAVHPDPGGSLVVLPIAEDGTLQPVTQKFIWPPSKANPERQVSSHAHQAIMSPDGKYVFECDLGGDKVYTYSYDGASADSHPLKSILSLSLPSGSGPRHLAFTANGKFAYLTMEMAGTVGIVDVKADGALYLRKTIKLAPESFKGKVGSGAVMLSPDQKYLYVSNRGDANTITVFSVAPETGELTRIQDISAGGKEPRVFSLSPDGRYFLIANQFSKEVVTFNRTPATGKLGNIVQRTPVAGGPSMLIFVQGD